MDAIPAPKAAECRSMPTDQGGRFDDNQGAAPLEESGQFREDEMVRCCRLPRSLVAFLEQDQLFAEEEILGGERSTVPQKPKSESHAIRGNDLKRDEELGEVPNGGLHSEIFAQAICVTSQCVPGFCGPQHA